MIMWGAILAGVSIASSLAGSYIEYQAQKDQAKAQELYYDWYRIENTKSINAELDTNLKQIQNRYFEELKASSFENQLASDQNLQSQRSAEASALENGLSTGSVEYLFASYQRNQALNDYMSAQNAKTKGYQLDVDMKSLKAKAQSAINNASVYDPSSIVRPSLSAALLGATGNALQIYSNYRSEQQRDKYFSKNSTEFITPAILNLLNNSQPANLIK